MSVRKRTWRTRTGEAKEAWIVDYTDQQGARHIHTFARKKDADAYEVTVSGAQSMPRRPTARLRTARGMSQQ